MNVLELLQIAGSPQRVSHLWDGTDEGWVLVRSRRSLPAIFNRVTRTALIIDDDELYAQVVQEMLDHGKELFEHLP